MNANMTELGRNRIPTRFAPDTTFEFEPKVATNRRDLAHDALESLKNRLLAARLGECGDPGLHPAIRRAADEATALASINPYPLLVLPELFEERAAAAVKYHFKQELIRRRTQRFVYMAA